ncbi:MAG: hypothetical protein K2L51_06270, partial [Clostridiales bacterium]|nr:hypothetical protein [Clostridiales bacterium]
MKINTHNKYAQRIREYAAAHYTKMLRAPDGILKHKFIVPGSCYQNELWDWDSWLTNIALRKLPCAENLQEYEKGCVLNFLEHTPASGAMPIVISPMRCGFDFVKKEETNIHKPVLVQHAVFVSEHIGDYEWLRPHAETVEKFLAFYTERCKHESGLYFWIDDCAIGVDNDPCTYYRPPKSSASIFLNCLLYAEFEAAEKLFEKLALPRKAEYYRKQADALRDAVQRECWDERDGFFYSADLNLLPVDVSQTLHSG